MRGRGARTGRLLALAGCVALTGLAAGPPLRADPPASPSGIPASGDFAGRVAIDGGRRLYLECRGSGGPTVILDSGLRGRADVWSHAVRAGDEAVFPGVARFTRVCAYDRPGTASGPDAVSRSDPVPMPRAVRSIVTDLHALLAAAAVPGPYVMVGHSTGGLIGRRYASSFPAEVAGLVLVDAISEAVPKAMTKRDWRFFNRRYLVARSPELAGYADLETIAFRKSFAQMRKAPKPPRGIPLVVLSKRKRFGVPADAPRGFSRALERAWRAGQRYLATLAPKTPRIVAKRSGHNIHVDQPGLVVREVRRILSRIRG
jgi:pimeloyl-ACP methyl ester carboxylesterase